MTANPNTPNGLQAITNSALGPTKVTPYYISNAQAALAIGTPVALATGTNSNAVIFGKEWPAGSLKAITLATGGDANQLLGTIVGFEQNVTSIMPTTAGYNPANTEGVAYVADSPSQEFTIVTDGGTFTSTYIGYNANLTIGTVNTFTGIDSTSLDTTTPATTSTYQLKILRLNDRPNNDLANTYQELVVQINNHQLANITTGV
jgi:hypothetical protein